MDFHWHANGVEGDLLEETGLDQRFATQADAEAWLTSSFADLLDEGIDAVTLMQGDHIVYGPMGLSA